MLSGGSSRRFGGADKTVADVAGRPLLVRALRAVRHADRVILVGPPPPPGALAAAGIPAERLSVTREDPPGGGPVAALATAMPLVTTEDVVVLAADMPFAERLPNALLRYLRRAANVDAAVAVDSVGRDQYLAASYRSVGLRGALPSPEEATGRPFRAVVDRLHVVRVPGDSLPPGSLVDVDTADDLAAAREAAGRRGENMVERWTRVLAGELGISEEVDRDLLLDIARTAAHSVARPAAPLTTFLIGVAAGRAASVAEGTQSAADIVRELAASWEQGDEPDGQ